MLCTPNALSQDGGLALGAQAGEVRETLAAGASPRAPCRRDAIQFRARSPAVTLAD
jgi:hypothetical protein